MTITECEAVLARLVDQNLRYDGANLVIPCGDHVGAMRAAADLRAMHETFRRLNLGRSA